LYRFFYVRFHDFCLSSVLGYLTLNEKLYVAVQKNDIYRARQLLAYGASPGFLPANQKSTLSRLIRNNHHTTYGCIDKNLFAAVLAGDSMLFTAVSNNNFPLIRELIQYHDYGAAGQHTEVVSLCLAVKHGYEHIVEYLIDYGHINPNECVQAGCNHCKVNSERNQRFQFPLYRK
jgi:ankyrin repeat protein